MLQKPRALLQSKKAASRRKVNSEVHAGRWSQCLTSPPTLQLAGFFTQPSHQCKTMEQQPLRPPTLPRGVERMACLHGELLWNAIRKPLDKHRPHYSSGRPHSIRPQKDIPHSRSLQRSLLPNARTDAMHKGHVPGRGRFPDLPTQVPPTFASLPTGSCLRCSTHALNAAFRTDAMHSL